MTRRVVGPKGDTISVASERTAPRTITGPVPSGDVPQGAGSEPSVPRIEPDRSNEPREGETFGSEFLDNIAHQMVAPLQSIQMHCSNIIKGRIKGDQSIQRLKEVVGHAKMLSDLARRMRFLHELVSGKQIQTERLQFEAIVTSWIDGFNNYLPIVQEQHFDVDIDHVSMNKLPEVVGSRLAVHQVLMNLYDNAMKYGKPRSIITIRAHLEGLYVVNEFQHVAKVRLTEAAAARIFVERGFRDVEARRAESAGSGLGMWISKRLMKSMQGDIEVTPTNEAGITKFRIRWRVAS